MVHELLKKPLGEITYITKLAGFEYTKHFDYEVGGEIIALRSMNIKNGKLDLAEVHTIPKSVSDALPRSQLKLNDVVLGYVGSKLGNLAKIEHDNKFHLAPNVAVIRPSEKIDSDYLLQYMQSSYFQSRLWAFASSTGQPALSMTNIRKLPILLLNIDEQCKIAQILSIWDKAISTTESLINNSKQQKKALMQQLLTSKKRLLDESGKPFEGEWKKTKLSNIADIIMGSSPKSSSYNKISEGLPLIQGNADIKNRKTAPRIYTSEVTKQCRVDDILLSVRAPVGTVAKSIHDACIGRGISAIKAKKKNSQSYIYQFLLWFEPRWDRYSQGSTFEAVNSNDIKSLHLLIPSFDEQQKIAAVLTNADNEIELLEQQLAGLKQEKKALMQQLLTGKRRVKVEQNNLEQEAS